MSRPMVRDLLQIFKSGVSAVLPENLIRKCLNYCELTQKLTVAGKQFDLSKKSVYVVGAGKAVQNMALEVEKILGPKIKMGIISIPDGSLSNKSLNKDIIYCEGAKNNLPDNNAVATAKKIENLANSLKFNDMLLVLISGGGSALLPLPKNPISLDEKTDLIKKLANSGADIKELNAVRKRLSAIKNGQLAIKANPATVVSLVLSDVIGDPLDIIACGPTVENSNDPSETLAILNKFKLQDDLPESIRTVLQQSEIDDCFPVDNVHNFLIGSNKLSTYNAFVESKSLNYSPIVLSNGVTGNVKDVAVEYSKMTKNFCDFLKGELDLDGLKKVLLTLKIPGLNSDPLNNLDIDIIGANNGLCLILGGEITVQVRGSGKGGRNQQLALEFSNLLCKMKDALDNFNVYFLSAGTDGIDGPTDAAGAIGYLDLISDAEKEGLNANLYIENNDCYNFYKKFRNGDLHVITGHTNTNVMDIHLIIIKKIETH